MFACDGRDLRHRLDRADLVLGMNDRDQRDLAIDGAGETAGIDASVLLRWHARDLYALALEQGAARFCRRMLDRACDNVSPSALDVHGAADRDVARLRSAAGKDDF